MEKEDGGYLILQRKLNVMYVPIFPWTAGGNHIALLLLSRLLAAISKLLQNKQGKEPKAHLPATIEKQFGTSNRWVFYHSEQKNSSARQPLEEKDGEHTIHDHRTRLRAKMYKP